MAEQTIQAERMEQLINVFGSLDENIKIIEQEFGVTSSAGIRSSR